MMRYRLTGAALVILTVIAVIAGSAQLTAANGPFDSPTMKLCIALSVLVYFGAAAEVHRGNYPPLGLVVVVALLMRLTLLLAHPLLTSDLYRYVWDGQVQLAGINPYLHVPADQALSFLRDDLIFPNLNRADYATTIYPPAAQAFFAATGLAMPGLDGFRVMMALMEVGVIVAIERLLYASQQSRAQVLIYAWNPLVGWEYLNNSHIDALGLMLALFAILCLVHRSPRWAGALFGAAVLTKFLPVVIAPALWQRGRWKTALTAVAVIVVLYAVYTSWGHAGWQALGFLGQYGHEEALDTGSGFWLLALLGSVVHLPAWAETIYVALSLLVLAGLGYALAFRMQVHSARAMAGAAAVMALALLILLSPHYAWYYPWIAGFAAIAPSAAAIWISAAAVLLYAQTLPQHVLLPTLVFLPALLLARTTWRAAHFDHAPKDDS